MKRFFLVTLLSSGLALAVNAQDFHMPKPSPTVSVNQGFSTSFIKLDYSRPSVKGRVIFGHLVPYGQVWRTGANNATKVTFGEDVSLDGHSVKAGEYALYTIPEKDAWTIILNTGVSNWGTQGFDKKDDVLQFTVPVQHLDKMRQTFSINIEDMTDNSCNIVLSWADAQVSIPVTADNNERIMAYLDEALKGDKPPYYQAASYYFASDQKMEEAAKYCALAIKESPKAYYMNWLQARIYEKLGKHQQAIDEAKQAAEKAKGSAFAAEYEQHYQDMLNAGK
ncbi:MAG TPA: DUF2911 domain-containing protein [Edaphocola sp.]|nr:DUF2911 domain-containing protein [Edaphocola sp.]